MIAAVLAMGTGLLTFQYLTSVGRHQSAVVAPRRIVIASRDIPARVTIRADMLAIVMRPGDAVDPDAIGDTASVVGRIAAVSVPAGGSISTSKITSVAGASLVTRVPRGMRAIAITLDRVKGVGNLVQPGDHVDVIAVTQPRPNAQPKAATILRDVPVLAMGTALETPQGATPAPDSGFQTASLGVTPNQAKMLALIDMNATLRLALRAPGEGSHQPTTGEALDLSQPAASQTQRAAPMPAAPPAAPQPAPPRPVALAAKPPSGPQIIEGDKVMR
ncbi:MAG TPA: Flp pilus assembly protein CpaB [Vicinamibacterales bacterium]|nr:Flp pilus assembly protein CpaB [Vicinamibacterales bacterium]